MAVCLAGWVGGWLGEIGGGLVYLYYSNRSLVGTYMYIAACSRLSISPYFSLIVIS